MDNEKLKLLRNKISIPLNVAIRLLKKNNDDIALCEQEFHNDNIKTICIKTECDYDVAKENYEICNYDVVKTVERINQKPVIITTGKTKDSKIGFILWPENEEGEFYKTAKRNDAFIDADDFDIILKEFQSVFPLKNPLNNIVENAFDPVRHNFFDNKTIKLIVEKIKLIENDDEKERAFLAEVIHWLNDKLTYAAYIVVYGNLQVIMNSKIEIRKIVKPDLNFVYKSICELENEILDFEVFSQIFNENILNPKNLYLLAEIEKEGVGFISFHTQNLLHHCGLVGEIQEFFIHQNYRGKGIGKQLVNEILQYADQNNLKSIEVTTNKKRVENVLIYENLGFGLTHNKFTIYK